jgi:uncharacterized protein YlxW (UPF0749 family)
MPSPNSNHPSAASNHDNDSASSERGANIVELLAEAEQLRSILQDATARLSRLMNGLKQHRRQGRAMQAAMQSLKQLQLGD